MRTLSLPATLRPVVLAAAIAVAATAAWAGWWAAAGQILQGSLESWAAAERGQGGTVGFGGLVLDGFPLTVRATLTDVAITRRDGLVWTGSGVVIEAPLWAVGNPRLRLTGRQDVRLPEGYQASRASVGGGEGSIRLGGAAGFTEAQLTVTEVRLFPATGDGAPATAARLEVTAGAPSHAVTEHTDAGLSVTLAADTLQVPVAGSLPLGPAIQSVSLSARVMGAPPRIEPAALAAWSRDGGTVELDKAAVRWGSLTLGAEGTLALDRDLQPVGALTAQVAGFVQAIDTLVAAGWVKPKQGQTAKAVLGGLSPRREGEPAPANPTAKLPISLHDRFVHLGPFRLAPLPMVVWGPAAAG